METATGKGCQKGGKALDQNCSRGCGQMWERQFVRNDLPRLGGKEEKGRGSGISWSIQMSADLTWVTWWKKIPWGEERANRGGTRHQNLGDLGQGTPFLHTRQVLCSVGKK